ncbi:MAG: D-alanyl-D-alanine carboxypeptidase [Clostridiales bacterium]|nr:D-alanyl-D-alanine carboxypeptidase [Clostridiales bacterium]
MKRILSSALVAILTICFIFPFTVLAVNDDLDNPDDGMVSQNESYGDLLTDPPSDLPAVTGTSYILYDCESNTVLMGKNIDSQVQPAAITKLMTVLIAMETLDLEDTITITQPMYIGIPENYYTLGVTEGEEVQVRDLIYAALLASDSDACLALAIKISGSEQLFTGRMNDRAAELGCTNTHFTNCYGNDDLSNLSTAHDMALILNECTNHQDFVDISTTFQHTMLGTNLYSDSRVISNANRFISTQEYSYDYYIGGLTGYSDGVGYSVAAASSKNGRKIVGIILGATDSVGRYTDMINMFDSGYSTFSTLPLDQGEFMPLYNDTIEQINSALLGTDLAVMESSMELSNYITTTSVRISLGSTNTVDLSSVVIDTTSMADQSFRIPICRSFNDGKVYIVGVLNVLVGEKDNLVSINPEKHSIWSGLRKALVTLIVILVLFIILVYALIVFRKKARNRAYREFRDKNKML